MWLDLILSTIAFFVASFWVRRFFDDQGFPHGMARSAMVLVIATAASFAVSAMVSWLVAEPSADQQMMKMVGQGVLPHSQPVNRP